MDGDVELSLGTFPILSLCFSFHPREDSPGAKDSPLLVYLSRFPTKIPSASEFSDIRGCVRLIVTLWTVAHQAPLSVGFSRQEYWSGLPCPPPGDLPDAGIEPRSPTFQADSIPPPPARKLQYLDMSGQVPFTVHLKIPPHCQSAILQNNIF